MDVFIPEEYVIRRRAEKKAAANGGKIRPNMEAEASISNKLEKEVKKSQLRPSPFQQNSNEFLVSAGGGGGITEIVVFGCLSA